MNDCIGCKLRRNRVALFLGCCTFVFAFLVIVAPARAFVLNDIGPGAKWGVDSTPGTSAIVSWGFMGEGTTVDPSFVMDPENYPGQSGLVGTSSIGTLQSQIDNVNGSGAFAAAIQGAFDTWSEVSNVLFFGPINDPGFPFGAIGATAPDIRIGAFLPQAGHSFEATGAVSFGPPVSGSNGEAGDVIFNLSAAINMVTGIEDVTPVPAGTHDLESLFLRELGNAAMGLGHPDWDGSLPDQRVMYNGDSPALGAPPCCQSINRELHEDDMAGAWYTYGIRGDHNGDGSTDAADYTVWRDEGQSASGYQAWVTRFGSVRTLPSGGTGESVPEPAGLVLAALGLAGFLRRSNLK